MVVKSELISLMRCQLPNVGQSPCLPRDPSLPLRLLLGPLINSVLKDWSGLDGGSRRYSFGLRPTV